MALKLAKEFKGYTAEYWCITKRVWNKLSNRTDVELSAYKDQATREADVQNFVRDLNQRFHFDGDKSLAECYTLIKTAEVGTMIDGGFGTTVPFEDAVDC